MVLTVSDEGQITIPRAVRERLQIRPGDRVELDEDALRPIPPTRQVSAEEWDANIANWQEIVAENLKGHRYETMNSAEIIEDLRGPVDETAPRG